MKQYRPVWLAVMLLAVFANPAAQADDHMIDNINVQQPFNIQANLCKLNAGVDLDDYQEMIDDYFEWAKENDVDPVFVRQFPLFSHQNLSRPWPYDFVEFLVSDYQRWGKAWDLWLTSQDGMALNERWQSLAMCHVKQAHAFMLYADQEQMATDDERYVTWNWCTRKEGVTFEEISAKHAEYAMDMQEDPVKFMAASMATRCPSCMRPTRAEPMPRVNSRMLPSIRIWSLSWHDAPCRLMVAGRSPAIISICMQGLHRRDANIAEADVCTHRRRLSHCALERRRGHGVSFNFTWWRS